MNLVQERTLQVNNLSNESFSYVNVEQRYIQNLKQQIHIPQAQMKGSKFLPYLSFRKISLQKKILTCFLSRHKNQSCFSIHIYIHTPPQSGTCAFFNKTSLTLEQQMLNNMMEYQIASEKTDRMKQKPFPILKTMQTTMAKA